MSDFFTSGERAALDRVGVPALRAGFAADVVSAANASLAVPSRSSTRGGWRRHGRLMIGAGALVLASATAAATGWLGKLPIAIPGITRVVEQPAAKPKHLVRAERKREDVGKAVALAAPPVVDPAAPAPALTTPGEQWRERREARVAAGLPVARPLLQRAMAEKLRGLPPAERKAAIAEWRRIKALPLAERKQAVAKIRADYLAAHPRMAQRYEQRLERRSLAAAAGGQPLPAAPAAPVVPGGQPQPPASPGIAPQGMGTRPALTPEERAERRQRWQERRMQRQAAGLPAAGPNAALTPQERAERRARRQAWRAQRLQSGQ